MNTLLNLLLPFPLLKQELLTSGLFWLMKSHELLVLNLKKLDEEENLRCPSRVSLELANLVRLMCNVISTLISIHALRFATNNAHETAVREKPRIRFHS